MGSWISLWRRISVFLEPDWPDFSDLTWRISVFFDADYADPSGTATLIVFIPLGLNTSVVPDRGIFADFLFLLNWSQISYGD